MACTCDGILCVYEMNNGFDTLCHVTCTTCNVLIGTLNNILDKIRDLHTYELPLPLFYCCLVTCLPLLPTKYILWSNNASQHLKLFQFRSCPLHLNNYISIFHKFHKKLHSHKLHEEVKVLYKSHTFRINDYSILTKSQKSTLGI